MHQTFYVETDEEITSIVEKIKKAQAKEVAMVVPKRALLIQSIINLRILKKEADERGLQLMIVTQDKLGKILIEKAGILVQQKIENNEDELNFPPPAANNQPSGKNENYQDANGAEKNRLDRIGSKQFFDENQLKEGLKADLEELKKAHNREAEDKREKLVNKELISGFCDIKNKPQKSGMDISPRKNDNFFSSPGNTFHENAAAETPKHRDKIENFFYSKNNTSDFTQPREDLTSFNLPKKTVRWFLPFGIFCVAVIGLIAAYLFVPKATVGITVNIKTKTIDTEILGDANLNSIDYEKEIIPAKIITVEKEMSQNFDSTGDISVSNQKARGMVAIYNEYSSSSQSLVATTRLLSEDGKLFRLVNGVTVPGMVKSGETMEPGKIEADVVADQPGEDFNIGAANFTIPGFKDSGNEKYSKFYGKSKDKMTGGGSGGEKVLSVSEGDVASAKSKLATELDAFIKSELEKEAGGGLVILEDAIAKEEAVYKISNSPGEAADNFLATAGIKASAMVFSEKDIKDLAGKLLAKSGGGNFNINSDSISLEYGKSDANLKTGLINIKFHAEGKLKPDFSTEEIKKEILGKSEDYLKNYLSGFKDIQKADIEYQPSFIGGRIPFRSSQVEVKLDN